jgi:hypothetical protein
MQGLLGQAKISEARGDFDSALLLVNEVHVKHSWFAPALIEKARLSLTVHGWAETMDTVAMLQQADSTNIFAFAYNGVHAPAHLLPSCCAIRQQGASLQEMQYHWSVPYAIPRHDHRHCSIDGDP